MQAEEKSSMETVGCTFKPQILGKKMTKEEEEKMRQSMGANKWNELYQQALDKKPRGNRTREEIEFERNPEEFTF